MPLAAWTITGSTPTKLSSASVGLERELESWIAADPSLVDRGFVILKRQLPLAAAGRLDLLCVDQQGRLAIVEIKRGTLMRDTIAQALDYVSVISSWSAETARNQVDEAVRTAHANHTGVAALLTAADDDDDEPREVEIVIVGCGADASVDRMIEFLGSRYALPIRAVSFDVFELDGKQILVRDERLTESPTAQPTASNSIDSVITKAGGTDSTGGKAMMAIADAAERNGLYARPYKYSIMLTPPQNRTRYLATVWRLSREQIVLTYSADAFAEFFPVSAAEVRQMLGPERLDPMTPADAVDWGSRLDGLFQTLSDGEADGGDAEAAES